MIESELPVVDFHPFRWGDPAHPAALPAAATAALAMLGVTGAPAATDPAAAVLPASRLPAELAAELAAAVGAENVRTDHATRVGHTRGWSTPDLIRLRAGDASDAPDAVVHPGSHDEVVAVLGACSRARVAVVPFSGGTSVVGGLAPDRAGFAAVVTLDLGRLDALLDVDPISRTATLQAGLRGPRGRATAGRARLHARPLPAVLREARASAATRPPGRPASRRPATAASTRWWSGWSLATPRGTIAARHRAEVGRRAGPAPAGAGLRGHARRDHAR